MGFYSVVEPFSSGPPITYVCQYNDGNLLNECLQFIRPNARAQDQVILCDGKKTQAKAYSDAEKKAKGSIIVFLHQDTILPPGWREIFLRRLIQVEAADKNWGLVGPCGVVLDKKRKKERVIGHYRDGNGFIQDDPEPITRVLSLDAFLYAKKKGTFPIDTNIPFYHGVVEDQCYQARAAKKSVWSIDAFAEHRSKIYPRQRKDIPQIKICADYLVKKWGLPVVCGNFVFWKEKCKT